MIKTKFFNPENKLNLSMKQQVADFLHEHLDKFRDPQADILKAVDYAMKDSESFGGFVLLAYDNSEIIGAVVVNQTGMKDYIPENILVYIATHKKYRGKGVGKQLMREAIGMSKGNMALHVEPDNTARFLYEKVGFTSKYLEMRLIK